MSEEISLTIREAQPNDASELLAMMQQERKRLTFWLWMNKEWS